MNTSQTITKINAAIEAVQRAVEPFAKNKAVDVKGDRAAWSSAYATLTQLSDAVREHVRAQRISIVQTTEALPVLGPCLVTRASYEDEWIEVAFPIKASRDGAQGFGGGITFARRWSICALFDLVPNDIEEGQGYKDAAREGKVAKRQAAPASLAALQDAIRNAEGFKSFEDAARKARSAHPSGEANAAIERTITARLVAGIDAADTAEKLEHCRALHGRLQARGPEVREAIGRAERRLRGES